MMTTGRIEVGNNVVPLCFQIHEDLLFSGWNDNSLKMHDLNTTKAIWSVDNCQKGGVTSLELSKNLKTICTGGQDG